MKYRVQLLLNSEIEKLVLNVFGIYLSQYVKEVQENKTFT